MKTTHERHVKALGRVTFERHLIDGIINHPVQNGILLLEGAGTESWSHPLADDSVLQPPAHLPKLATSDARQGKYVRGSVSLPRFV